MWSGAVDDARAGRMFAGREYMQHRDWSRRLHVAHLYTGILAQRGGGTNWPKRSNSSSLRTTDQAAKYTM